jgi:hypothetical protein
VRSLPSRRRAARAGPPVDRSTTLYGRLPHRYAWRLSAGPRSRSQGAPQRRPGRSGRRGRTGAPRPRCRTTARAASRTSPLARAGDVTLVDGWGDDEWAPRRILAGFLKRVAWEERQEARLRASRGDAG